MIGFNKIARISSWAVLFICLLNLQSALAIDIPGTRSASFGLPEANVVFRPSAGALPYQGFDVFDLDVLINLRMVFDTGASGIILGTEPAQQIGIPVAEFPVGDPNAVDVVFADVGIGGDTLFGVSDTLHMSLGHFTLEPPAEYVPGITTYPREYPDIRLQLGPEGLFDGVVGRLVLAGIVGMPAMLDKISVIQPKLAETFADTIHTYVYDPAVAPSLGPGYQQLI